MGWRKNLNNYFFGLDFLISQKLSIYPSVMCVSLMISCRINRTPPRFFCPWQYFSTLTILLHYSFEICHAWLLLHHSTSQIRIYHIKRVEKKPDTQWDQIQFKIVA